MKAAWQAEKDVIDEIQTLKARVDELRIEADRATRTGELNRAAEINYGEIPQADEGIDAATERLAELPDSERIDSGDPRLGKLFDKLGQVRCPVCDAPMVRMVDREQPHIWYESCTVCNGHYFDAGEFTDFKEHTVLDRVRDLFVRERG